MIGSKAALEVKSRQSRLIRNIQALLQEKDMTEAELSRKTGIPQPTLHKIMSGSTADPRISTLQAIANYFEISIDNLVTSNLELYKSDIKDHLQSVPIISWSDCLKGRDFYIELSSSNWSDWITIEYHTNDIFGLISKPASEPRFPKGSIFIIDPNANYQDGDLIIVQYPATDEATIRELYFDGPTKLLIPLNANSETRQYNESIKIIGTLIQTRFTYYK